MLGSRKSVHKSGHGPRYPQARGGVTWNVSSRSTTVDTAIREIAVLVYRCPTTHRQVTSAIQTTAKALARLGALKLSLWCPHCDDAHTVCAREAAVQPAGPGEAV
jgi:hypothetical protein